jgi:hypothetical protein
MVSEEQQKKINSKIMELLEKRATASTLALKDFIDGYICGLKWVKDEI